MTKVKTLSKKRVRQTKNCSGCDAPFITYANYDYCANCKLNNSRYVKQICPECGDGSGWVKFPKQPPRKCKLCFLSKKNMNKQEQDPQEKFWGQVDLLAQENIYKLLTQNIPLNNLNLITEPYRYEDRQQKLTGLFLHRDVDYRTLLDDVTNQYSEELPDKEVIAEEIALWYCRLVVKALIQDVSDYASYDPSYFSDLTDND